MALDDKNYLPPLVTLSPDASEMKLCLNLLPVSYPPIEAVMCFTPVPLEGLYPVKPDEVPKELAGMVPRSRRPGCFYTNGLPGGPGIPLTVNLAAHRTLARLWCMQHICSMLEPQADYCLHSSPGTAEFWYSTGRMPDGNTGNGSPEDEPCQWQSFHRFILKIVHRRNQPCPELLVGYNGIGCILKAGIGELADRNPDTRTIKKVAFRKHIYRWEKLPQAACYHIGEALPLVTAKVARWLELPRAATQHDIEKENCLALLSAFMKTHLPHGAFPGAGPAGCSFLAIEPADTGCVPAAGGRLLFGEEGTSADPLEGVALHGPLKLPYGSHFSCFTVCFGEDRHLALELVEWVVGPDPSRRLGSFIRVPMRFSHDHCIFLSHTGDVEQQLEQHMMEMEFDADIVWLAFYICPAGKPAVNGEAQQLHAFIARLFLQRGVLVQKIPAARIAGNFFEHSRLPGLDVLVRMGGTPWRPEGDSVGDPVAGFAVHPGIHPPGPGVGAAVFFTPGGLFAGADVFNPAHEREWGGLAMEFLRNREMEGHTAQRLVLHLMRPLKKHEQASLQAMIGEWRPGLQVVAMVIRRCSGRHIRAFRSDDVNARVPDGTWVRCSNNSYLLYTQGAVQRNQSRPVAVPLSVRFSILNPGSDTTGQLAPALLSQLHCLTRMHRPQSAPQYLPVTLTYPALLARLIPRLRSHALPEYGRKVPWFI